MMQPFCAAVWCAASIVGVQRPMSFRLTPPQIQWLDQYGNPLTGGQLFFYQTQSANLAETFSDSGETILSLVDGGEDGGESQQHCLHVCLHL